MSQNGRKKPNTKKRSIPWAGSARVERLVPRPTSSAFKDPRIEQIDVEIAELKKQIRQLKHQRKCLLRLIEKEV